jgi:hypothetical protein
MPLNQYRKEHPVARKGVGQVSLRTPQWLVVLLTLCCAISAVSVSVSVVEAQPKAESSFTVATGKKLIEYGCDQFYANDPAFIRDNIKAMEEKPFEGIAFRLPAQESNIFEVKDWQENSEARQKQLNVLSSIKWSKFTDNFLTIYSVSDMDWYSDSDWTKVLSKARYNAKAARAAGCVGIVFDPESYGSSPWVYAKQKHAGQHTYAEYSDKAYQRGQQFMQALESELPGLKLLMLFQYSWFYDSTHHLNSAKRAAAMQKDTYGLMLPFLNGMLAEAGPKVQLIDGNEASYYYTKPENYYNYFWKIRQGAHVHVPDPLKAKFDRQVRAGNAVYVDHLFDMRFKPNISAAMTPEERAKWVEQNVYYALKTSDEYVWLYSEQMDWFNHTSRDVTKGWVSFGQAPPAGIVDAIVSAKAKLKNSEDLGYSMDAIFEKAQAQIDQKLERRTAILPYLNPQQRPRIDGKLDKNLHLKLPWLDPFVGYMKIKGFTPIEAQTRAYAAYDNDNLYIAFQCDEPNMKEQKVSSGGHDSSVWNGENVDISILQPGQPTNDPNAVFYHLILNPANNRWDGLNTGTSADAGYNPGWESATQTTATGWTAEIRIPWKEIGITNVRPGLQLRASLARHRVSKKSEFSSWSQFVSGFQEPHNFGTWTLDK